MLLIAKNKADHLLVIGFAGATDPIRTDDLLITSELLYLLSHSSIDITGIIADFCAAVKGEFSLFTGKYRQTLLCILLNSGIM